MSLDQPPAQMENASLDSKPTADAGQAGVEALGYRQELKRSLSSLDLLIYGLVFIAPIAPWTSFGFVYNISRGMVPLVYVIGLVAMMFTAISYMTMSRAFPVSGSVYAYAGRGIGPAAGFLAGWALLLDYLLFPALIYVISAATLHAVLPIAPKPLVLAALLASNTAINLFGIENTARLGKVMLLIQLAMLGLFMALAFLGVLHGVGGAHFSLDPIFNEQKFTPSLLFGALSLAVLSFLGFDAISTLAEEAKGGARAVGTATLLSLLLAAALFIAQTYLASLFVLGRRDFADGDEAATAFYVIAGAVGGQGFRFLLSIFGVLLAGQAAALAAQAATARLLFSMARDSRLPRPLAKINPRTGAPDRAILLTAAITAIIGVLLVNQIELLTSMVTFGALTGFMALHLAVAWHFMVRQRSQQWLLHLLFPTIGFAIVGYVLFNAQAAAKITGACWLAAGAVVLLIAQAMGRSTAAFVKEEL